MTEGYVPVAIEHFGGQVSSWPPRMLDPQLATVAENVRFTQSALSSREGLTRVLSSSNPKAIIGLAAWQQSQGVEPYVLPRLLFADGGLGLFIESAPGSGVALPIAWTGQAATKPSAASQMNAATAYGRSYLAFSDGKFGTGCCHWDGTNLDPVTTPAPGAGASAADSATAGNIAGGVRFAVVMYKLRDGSLSAASPPFSWTAVGLLPAPSDSPTIAAQLTSSGASTLPAGTYYIQTTWKNGSGETTAGPETSIAIPAAPSGAAYILTVTVDNPPPGATEMGVYISTASGAEKLQFYVGAAQGASADISAAITTNGAAPPSTNGSGRQATISSLPIGPANVTARVVAFTTAGGVAAGPYFYIEEAQTVNGVSETATLVNDNVATSATFNFDDDFLAASLAAGDYLDAQQITEEAGVCYSALTDRLLWWGEPANPSIVRVSEPADAGLYKADTGLISVAPNDGTRVTSVFEWRDSLYVAKENSIYRVTPNDGDPATWQVTQLAYGIGACSARGVGITGDWCVFVHRSGLWMHDGNAFTNVSDEELGFSRARPGFWERINWSAEQTVWAHVDVDDQCLRIGVPLDGATAPGHILKVSFRDGWGPSLRFSSFTARYHYFPGRRYSLDTIAASQGLTVERTATMAGFPADRRQGIRQIMLASAADDGAIAMIDPSADTDNGQPFICRFRTGGISAAEKEEQERQGTQIVGLIQLRASGRSRLNVSVVPGELAPIGIGSVDLTDPSRGDLNLLARVVDEAPQIELSGLAPWRISALYAWTRPWLALRPRIVPQPTQ